MCFGHCRDGDIMFQLVHLYITFHWRYTFREFLGIWHRRLISLGPAPVTSWNTFLAISSVQAQNWYAYHDTFSHKCLTGQNDEVMTFKIPHHNVLAIIQHQGSESGGEAAPIFHIWSGEETSALISGRPPWNCGDCIDLLRCWVEDVIMLDLWPLCSNVCICSVELNEWYGQVCMFSLCRRWCKLYGKHTTTNFSFIMSSVLL